MKKHLTNNIGLKILSLIIAIVAWLVIINIDDPVITKTVTGIEVDLQNEKSISDAGKYYKVNSGNIVSIVVKGKKSIVDFITSSDFKAVADLSKSSITNAVPVEVTPISRYGNDLEIIEGKSNTLMISLEDYISKQYNVTSYIRGKVAQGYYLGAGEISASPSRINISGPESVISKIATVKYIVDVADVNSSFSTVCEPVAYDANNNRISAETLDFSVSKINVSVNPLYLMDVPVNIVVDGEPADGYKVVKQSGTVSTVSLAFSDASLKKKFKSIDIIIDVDGVNENIKKKVSLSDYIPAGTKIVSEEKNNEVNIKVEELKIVDIEFTSNDIKFSNIMNDVLYNYVDNYPLLVQVRGLNKDVKDLTIDELLPTIDMSKLKIGSQNVVIAFSEIEGVEVINEPTIRVSLEEKQEVVIPDDIPSDIPREDSQEARDTDDVNEPKNPKTSQLPN